jgi:hypothetical protein
MIHLNADLMVVSDEGTRVNLQAYFVAESIHRGKVGVASVSKTRGL